MSKLTKTAGALVVSLALTCGAQASQAAEKIGYVNRHLVFQKLTEKVGLKAKINKEFDKRITEVQDLQVDIQAKTATYKKDSLLMKDDEKTEKEREINRLKSELKLKIDALNQDLAKREKELFKGLGVKIKKAVTKVAEKSGYDLVIDTSAVLYAKPEYDLSKKVLDAVK